MNTEPPAIPKKPRGGIRCPNCGSPHLAVTDTVRPIFGVVIRYRKCSACGAKLKTREMIAKFYPPESEPVG